MTSATFFSAAELASLQQELLAALRARNLHFKFPIVLDNYVAITSPEVWLGVHLDASLTAKQVGGRITHEHYFYHSFTTQLTIYASQYARTALQRPEACRNLVTMAGKYTKLVQLMMYAVKGQSTVETLFFLLDGPFRAVQEEFKKELDFWISRDSPQLADGLRKDYVKATVQHQNRHLRDPGMKRGREQDDEDEAPSPPKAVVDGARSSTTAPKSAATATGPSSSTSAPASPAATAPARGTTAAPAASAPPSRMDSLLRW
jgi:hypothetical protein